MPLPPTRCISCGRVIGDAYQEYRRRVALQGGSAEPPMYYRERTDGVTQKSVHGRVLDELHIHSGCCRVALLCQPLT